MLPFTKLKSRLIPLPVNNIDTDQIIPARYLKVIDKNGLADGLFYSWRYFPDGSPNPNFCVGGAGKPASIQTTTISQQPRI
jgi:3-isopropylmalate/(R)-2-methylmalate dehydratase small subunit